MMEDHYEVLNIPRFSTQEEARKSYRKLALRYHPDKNKDEGAEERFKRIQKSYQVLADTVAKAEYDSELRKISSIRSGFGSGSSTSSTFTTTTTFRTSTTRASFNPTPKHNASASPGRPGPGPGTYQNRSFDHLFNKTNTSANNTKPKSKFHYSNYERSSTTNPAAAAAASPRQKENPYTANFGSDNSNSKPTQPKSEVGQEPGQEEAKRRYYYNYEYSGKGFEKDDPIVLDDLDESSDDRAPEPGASASSKPGVGSESDNDEGENDVFVDASSTDPATASRANAQDQAQDPAPPETPSRSERHKRSGSVLGSGAKKIRFSATSSIPKGASGRINRTFLEEQEILDTENENPAQNTSEFIAGFENVRNVPPFTKNYGDINLDEMNDVINGTTGHKRTTTTTGSPKSFYTNTNGKRMRKDNSERLPHEPVNNFAQRFGQAPAAPPAPQQTEFINDHPDFNCRLPIDYSTQKQMKPLSVSDICKIQFQLETPTLPISLNRSINNLTEYKQFLNHFYVYEEHFKIYQTSYLSYMKIRTECDIFHMKNIFGYNNGVENLNNENKNQVNLVNLNLYLQVMANDTLICQSYLTVTREHAEALMKFYEICHKAEKLYCS